MEKILREVLADDKSILTRRDELIKILDDKVPGSLMMEYSALKTALQLNIGETFASKSDLATKKAEAVKRMTNAGMQEEFIEFVVNTFVKALDLDEPDEPEPEPEKEIKVEEEVKPVTKVNKTKVNTTKINTKKNKSDKNSNQSNNQPAETPQNESKPEPTTSLVKVEKPVHEEEEEQQIIIEEPVRRENPFNNNYNNFSNTTTINVPENRLDKIFTTQGRLNRKNYLIKSIKLLILFFISFCIVAEMGRLGFILTLVSFVGYIMIGIRRLHDLNHSGWFMLIDIIPYVNILLALYLLFFKGTDGPNKYGEDPLDNR